MHQSAMNYGRLFFKIYCADEAGKKITIVDVGSQDVNGSLREVSPINAKYIGIDFVSGNGVDLVISDPYNIPLEDLSVDVVLCSSCFEHSEFFWLVFLEVMRVLKDDGIFYLNAPSNGYFHQWPVDCWRFYPDSGKALVSWAKRNGYDPLLLESFIGGRSAGGIAEGGMWNDFVAVFIKDAKFSHKYPDRILNEIAEYTNGYSSNKPGILNQDDLGPDFRMIEGQSLIIDNLKAHAKELEEAIGSRVSEISFLGGMLANQNLNLEKAERIRHDLHCEVIDRDQEIKKLQAELNELQIAMQSLNNEPGDLDKKITNKIAHIIHLEQVIEARDGEIKRLDSQSSALHLIFSWNLKAKLNLICQKIKSLAPPYAINATHYRWLKKISLRAGVSPLRRAKLRRLLLLQPQGSQIGELNFPPIPLSPEDHWGDYSLMREAIVKYEQSKIDAVRVMPKDLIDYSGKNLLEIAKKISFKSHESPRVSIILPVFNNICLTLECLSSIYFAKCNTPFEIIVADDASKDDTQMVLRQIEGIKLIRSDLNLGFLRNCNAAFPLSMGQYVLILNSDVQVTDFWLEGLLEVFDVHIDAGTVGPKMIYPSGHLQEAGIALDRDGSVSMVGLNDDPDLNCYNFSRTVDYCSGACLMIRRDLLVNVGFFSDEFAPAYYEDADLGMKVLDAGFKNYLTPKVSIIHHLSKTMQSIESDWKKNQILINKSKFYDKWAEKLSDLSHVRTIAFYLPQFHEIKENNDWWGSGFTEWTNVSKAKPNFIGHYQPRKPSDLGYYNLSDIEIMRSQVKLAQRYGVDGFCFYYYWFDGKRLLETPIENWLLDKDINFPFCLCWANENWTRRWDGNDNEILIGQNHTPKDDRLVILDLIRYFKSKDYIRINGKPLLLIYRVDLFPDFEKTAQLWRKICIEEGIGEIYLAMVESHNLVHSNTDPSIYCCDASVEFPPLNMAKEVEPSGDLINKNFTGGIGDYRQTLLSYCAREQPPYKRFRGVMPGWDNTARRQNNGFIFEHSSPGAFQAWVEFAIEQTRKNLHGDERVIFINAWNEWAEGAYLEPDLRYGHAYLEALKNAQDSHLLSCGGCE